MPLHVPVLEPCPLCDFSHGPMATPLVHRDEFVATVVTRQQRGLGHVLVIPLHHRETILDVPPEEHGPLMRGIARAAAAIVAAYDSAGVVTWQNNGVPGNQKVPHVHFHVAGTLPEGGTDWGEPPILTPEEAEAIAGRLRAHVGE